MYARYNKKSYNRETGNFNVVYVLHESETGTRSFNRHTYVGNLDLRTEADKGIETSCSTLQYGGYIKSTRLEILSIINYQKQFS
jgi:hypothetical protein